MADQGHLEVEGKSKPLVSGEANGFHIYIVSHTVYSVKLYIVKVWITFGLGSKVVPLVVLEA